MYVSVSIYIYMYQPTYVQLQASLVHPFARAVARWITDIPRVDVSARPIVQFARSRPPIIRSLGRLSAFVDRAVAYAEMVRIVSSSFCAV